MASPFRHFRKHSKAFMATAAVLCMFLFVLGSALTPGRDRNQGGGNRNETVASWNNGTLTAGELAQLTYQRRITNEFLAAVLAAGGYQFQPYEPIPGDLPSFLLPSNRVDVVESAVIDAKLTADLAREGGMTVSNNVINYYITQLGQSKLDDEQIEFIYGKLGEGNARHNETIVFSTLRDLLLAHFYQAGYTDELMVMLPEERWEDWRRVNERISLQVAEVPTESFVSQVPEPTEVQLRQLYDQFKESDPDQFFNVGGQEFPSPDPVFAEPRRVTLQYLLGSVVERTEKLKSTVTDKEIEEYYERNKRFEFQKMTPLSDAVGDATDAADNAAPSATESATGDAAEAPNNSPAPTDSAPEASTDSATTTPVAEPATETPPAAEGESAPTSESTPAATGEPAPPAAEEPPATETEETPAKESESSSVRPSSPFRLASYQEQPGDATDSGADSESEPATASSEETPAAETSEPAAASSEPAASAPADSTATPAAETPATPAAGAATDSADTTTGDATAPGDPATPSGDQPAEKPVEYEPLDAVRETIRERLARDKAVVELEKDVRLAEGELQNAFNKFGIAAIEAAEKEQTAPKPPATLTDFGPPAAKYGLTAEKMAPLTERELSETAVGRATDANSGRIRVLDGAFLTLEMYEPFVAKELEGDWYIVMKIADAPRRVPEFADVRDRVAAAWKQREAAKLAETKAKELAEAAEKSGQPFDQFLADKGYKFIPRTEYFSWISYGAGGPGLSSPQLSSVPELKNIGNDFMRIAFALEDNKVASTMNFDRSAAYVFKLDRRQYDESALRTMFLEEINQWPGANDLKSVRARQFTQAVSREIQERTGLEMNNEWIQRRQEELLKRN